MQQDEIPSTVDGQQHEMTDVPNGNDHLDPRRRLCRRRPITVVTRPFQKQFLKSVRRKDVQKVKKQLLVCRVIFLINFLNFLTKSWAGYNIPRFEERNNICTF